MRRTARRFTVKVNSTTSAPCPAATRIPPAALGDLPTPSMPLSVNRFRHRRTASESTRERRAISSFGTPSEAHSNAGLHHLTVGNTEDATIRWSS